MNIGIDIDDTICNTTEGFLAYGTKFLMENNIPIQYPLVNTFHAKKALNFSDQLWQQFMKKYHDTIIADVHAKPLMKEILHQLKKDGHIIKFITARPDSPDYDSKKITQDWLIKNNIPHDLIIYGCKCKDQHCLTEKIDVFIDDVSENCLNVARHHIKTFVFNNMWNQDLNDPHITRIYSWPHFYEEIQTLNS